MEQKTTIKKYTTSCGAVVYKLLEGTIYLLLVRPFNGRDSWGVPKGHIDLGETNEQCAAREVFEETGISVILEEELSHVMTRFRDEKKTVITFLAQQSCETCVYPRDGENVDVKWFSEHELPLIHIYQKPLITQAIAKIRSKNGNT